MTEAPAGSEQPNFLIVTGGGLGRPVLVPIDLGDATVVIAADSGLDVARDAGFAVHHVVGDLDSARPEAVQDAVGRGAILHRHLCDKDATDFEPARRPSPHRACWWWAQEAAARIRRSPICSRSPGLAWSTWR
jgi:hypothetical protein